MGWVIIIGLLIAAIAVVGFGIKIYNNLVIRRNKVKNSWAHIDAQLQRRFDLIPNLVETVKVFAAHEKYLLDKVTASINEYVNAHNNQEKIAANEQLTSYLKSLYTVSEKYPQLRSNANFLQLQNALTEIEEDITYARQFYNDAVTIYNNQIMMFPNSIIASMYGFKEETLFDADRELDAAPKIQLRTSRYSQCPICGASVSADSINCEYCGGSLV